MPKTHMPKTGSHTTHTTNTLHTTTPPKVDQQILRTHKQQTQNKKNEKSAKNKIPATGWLRDMAAWLKTHSTSGYYYRGGSSTCQGTTTFGSNHRCNEGGVDLTAPSGTPITALGSGRIVAIGRGLLHSNGNPIYDVITIRTFVPGVGWEDLYYQHILAAAGLHVGQQINKGQRLGVVGPFGETEIGFNAGWGGAWGTNHPGPWVDNPLPWIEALMNDTSTALTTGTSSTKTSKGPPPRLIGLDTRTHTTSPRIGAQSNALSDLSNIVGKTTDITNAEIQQSRPNNPPSTACQWYDVSCNLQSFLKSEVFQRSSIILIGSILALVGIILLFVGHGGEAK